MLKIIFVCFCFFSLPFLSMAQTGRAYTSKGGEQIFESMDGQYYYSNKKMKDKKLELMPSDENTLKFKFANSKDKNIYVFVIEWKCEKVNAYVRINPDKSKTRFESSSDPCFR
ncbi:MAG: hypothetical protein EAZ85_00315 [Bacteroidetes bacterium]|nr:MAG: hypothetical protein EAZ85_00315 [Bacteroidota bacterium]TAG90338.1 MAG: hypothetical protein EAZ20_04650 [Bacteroidota bacterium]